MIWRAGGLLLSLAALRPAPAGALDEVRPLAQYGREVWQTEQGLPQNSIQAILQTRDGYLWVGTQEGLARFDGVRFVVFDRRSVPQFRSNLITALHADSRDRLWIGTSSGQVVLENGQFKTVGLATALASASVYDIIEDWRGDIWFATEQSLFREHAGIVEAVNLGTPVPTGRIRALLEDRDKTIWVATALQGTLRIDNRDD